MPLTIEALNADSTFLLTLSLPSGLKSSSSSSSLAQDYTILIDPWLIGPSSILHPAFQLSHHVNTPVISTLADLKRQPDLVIASQAKPDHCHRETLTTLPRNFGQTRILAPTATAKKILSWRHFHPDNVLAIPPFRPDRPDSVLRFPLPANDSPDFVDGEITIADITSRFDIAGLHNAIGITYRPPSRFNASESEQSLQSIIYTPHGLSPSSISPYIETFLQPLGCLPITALVHSTCVEQNPWFMGGLVCNGAPAGVRLAEKLQARHWIGAHDEQKQNSGMATVLLKTRRYGPEEVTSLLRAEGLETELHCLSSGETVMIK